MMLWGLLIMLLVIAGGVWGWAAIAAALGFASVNDKQSALQHIRQLMHTHDISVQDIERAFSTPTSVVRRAKRSQSDIARTLFIYLGAILVFAGVTTYIGSFWEVMGGFFRVLLTLGIGYALYTLLVVALYENRYPKIVIPLAIAAAIAMSIGWQVLIREMFPQGDCWRCAVCWIAGMMSLHMGALCLRFKHPVLSLLTLLFVYAFCYVALELAGVAPHHVAIGLGASLFVVAQLMENSRQRVLVESVLMVGCGWLNSGLYDAVAQSLSANWAGLLVGINVMSAAFGLHLAQHYPRLVGLGYWLGSMLAYAALFDLVQGGPMELLFPVVTAALLYACVVLESPALLFTSVLALLGFIGYYSAEYFADSLGWPITLVLMGVAFLAVGMVALRLKRQM